MPDSPVTLTNAPEPGRHTLDRRGSDDVAVQREGPRAGRLDPVPDEEARDAGQKEGRDEEGGTDHGEEPRARGARKRQGRVNRGKDSR